MKILLDSTCLLPAIGVNIEGLSPDVLKELLNNDDYDLYYCEITLFEIAAKGARLSLSENSITADDITRGIDSIKLDRRLQKLSWYTNPLVMDLAVDLRKIHSDFIDCLILATAICFADRLVTYDDTLLKKIKADESMIKKISNLNGSFSFWLIDLSKKPVNLTQ